MKTKLPTWRAFRLHQMLWKRKAFWICTCDPMNIIFGRRPARFVGTGTSVNEFLVRIGVIDPSLSRGTEHWPRKTYEFSRLDFLPFSLDYHPGRQLCWWIEEGGLQWMRMSRPNGGIDVSSTSPKSVASKSLLTIHQMESMYCWWISSFLDSRRSMRVRCRQLTIFWVKHFLESLVSISFANRQKLRSNGMLFRIWFLDMSN